MYNIRSIAFICNISRASTYLYFALIIISEEYLMQYIFYNDKNIYLSLYTHTNDMEL